MKRITLSAIVLALALVFMISGCAKGEDNGGKLKIVATNFAMYDFSRQIAGELAEVTMLLSPGSDAHDIEATLEDAALISSADIIVSVGGEDEKWLDDVLLSMEADAGKIKLLRALDCVELLDVPENLTVSEDHGHEHEHGEKCSVDEHVWTSPKNAVLIADRIRGMVMDSLPDCRDEIGENYDSFKEKLDGLDSELEKTVAQAERKSIIVADRFPFLYLTSDYGIKAYAAFSGCSSKTEPSLAVLAELIDTAEREKIPVIFTIEFSDGTTAKAIQDKTGAEILTLHSAHNVEKNEFESGITYVDIMKKNIEALKLALGG